MRPILFLACCLALALPARAATAPFAEFRVPGHAWRTGSAGFDFSANRRHQSTAGSFDRSSSLYSALNGGLRAGWDSDALQYGFSLSAAGQLMTSHSRGGSDLPPYEQRQESVGRQSSGDWVLGGSLRAYPWKTPVGLGISAYEQGVYSQSWSRSDYLASQGDPEVRRSEAHQTGAGHNYQTMAFADLSAGFGRVRDASVVYDVHLLEERLLETGALTRPLSADAHAKLAALYYVAPFFSAVHERPDRFVWREIERVLSEDGALSERGLDPYSVMRAGEPRAPGRRPMRQRGYFVGLVSQVTTLNYIGRSEHESTYRLYDSDILADEEHSVASQRTVSSYDQATLGGEAECHLPVGWRWQLDAAARVAGPARPGENGLDVSNRVSLSWFVADRWAASASVAQDRGYFRPRGAGGALASNRWATSVVTSVAYYLEDRTSLSLTLSEAQTRTQYGPGAPQVFYRDGRISLGISRRFLGKLDAPGLIEPVRQL
jgi:hypothetical protein